MCFQCVSSVFSKKKYKLEHTPSIGRLQGTPLCVLYVNSPKFASFLSFWLSLVSLGHNMWVV